MKRRCRRNYSHLPARITTLAPILVTYCLVLGAGMTATKRQAGSSDAAPQCPIIGNTNSFLRKREISHVSDYLPTEQLHFVEELDYRNYAERRICCAHFDVQDSRRKMAPETRGIAKLDLSSFVPLRKSVLRSLNQHVDLNFRHT